LLQSEAEDLLLVWSGATDKRDWQSQAHNKGLLQSEAENLLLVWSGATDRRDWQSQAHNKGLLQSGRNFSGRQIQSLSDSQSTGSLCLEKLYQSGFTAAKSSNGSSRLFCFNAKI